MALRFGDDSLDPDAPVAKPSQAPSPSAMASALDPGMAASLGPMMGAGLGGNIEDLLSSSLLSVTGGWGTRSITRDPYHYNANLIPDWVKEADKQTRGQLFAAAKGGTLDPFLPIANNPETWQVYLGEGPGGEKPQPERHGKGARPDPAGFGYVPNDNTETAQVVLNEPYMWDEDEVADAIKKFQEAGATDVKDFDSLMSAWGGLVSRAAATYSLSHGKRKLTPWDTLDLYKNEMSKAGTFGGSGVESGGPATSTNVTRSVNKITEGDAWRVMQSTLSQLLGRDPEDDELRDFTYRMNSLAAKNPSISKTISHNDGEGNISSNTTQTAAGFNANDVQQAAYEDAQSDPDYAEYQAATTYFNAAVNALGAIGG